jgi:hypothetical protein
MRYRRNKWAVQLTYSGFFTGRAITPSDSADIPNGMIRGFYVAVAGDVKCTMGDGAVCTWPALSAGVPHPIQAKRIWSTGTTATGIVGG